MSSTATQPADARNGAHARARNVAIGALFALVLLIPKLLRVRRNERSWALFRLAMGTCGAALVVIPLGLWNSWIVSLFGLAIFIAAILLPPAKPEYDIDEKARELGASIVLNGGKLEGGKTAAAEAFLFVNAEKIWALDSRLQLLAVVPLDTVSSIAVTPRGERWILQIRCADQTMEFAYSGFFAEHLARVAEITLRGLMRPALPVIPKSRAASA